MNIYSKNDSHNNSRICVFLILALGAVFYIRYCSLIMVEVPQQTWFDQLPLAELFYSENVKFSDLLSRYGEHGMLANNIFYLINLALFHGCTMFDVIINDINVLITGGMIIWLSFRMLHHAKNYIYFLIAEAFFLFSPVQGSSGGMETQVRLGLLFFLISMIFIDEELRNSTQLPKKHFYQTILLIFISINVFGTLYSFAGVPLVWFLIFFKKTGISSSDQEKKRITAIAGAYFMTVVLYIIEYRLYEVLKRSSNSRTGILHNLIYMISHPIHTMKCLFSWYANGVFGWAAHESSHYNQTVWLFVGALVLSIILYAVYLFISTKMYVNSWIPLMCIVYSFGVFVMVYLGREVEWEWFSNEWYNVHIKLALAGAVWIFGYAAGGIKIRKIICRTSVSILCVFSCIGSFYALKRAPHVHNYYKNMQKYLFIDHKNEMPVDESGMTPLLHSLDVTMDSIDILQKYHLSVYKYWDAYENCPTTGLVGNQVKFINGKYEDGWTERVCSFQLRTKEADQIIVNYYTLEKQKLTIIKDGETIDTVSLAKGKSFFRIPCEPDTEITIELQSDYEVQLDAPDTRTCSYMILDIERIQNS